MQVFAIVVTAVIAFVAGLLVGRAKPKTVVVYAPPTPVPIDSTPDQPMPTAPSPVTINIQPLEPTPTT